MVQIHTRAGTPEERQLVEGWHRLDGAGWVFVGMLFAVIPFLLLGQLGWGLGIAFAPHLAGLWRFFGWCVAAAVFYVPMRTFVLKHQRLKAELALDLQDFQVQEIVVAYAGSTTLKLQGSEAPALLIDLGQERALCLHGDFLLQHQTYGAVTPGEFETAFFNGLPAPFSFPSDRFVLRRLPHSGRVLGITLHGEYLAPVKSELYFSASEKESVIVERQRTRIEENG